MTLIAMQSTDFIFDPAANSVKFLMIVMGRSTHIVLISLTANIIITIMQVLHRFVPDYLVLNVLQVIANLYVFLPLIAKVCIMMSSRIMTVNVHARMRLYVIGPVMTQDAE